MEKKNLNLYILNFVKTMKFNHKIKKVNFYLFYQNLIFSVLIKNFNSLSAIKSLINQLI